LAGVSTSTRDCPAAAVEGPGRQVCHDTRVLERDQPTSRGPSPSAARDCQVKHVWETFAIAPLPEDGMTNNARDLIKHPDVPVPVRAGDHAQLQVGRGPGGDRAVEGPTSFRRPPSNGRTVCGSSAASAWRARTTVRSRAATSARQADPRHRHLEIPRLPWRTRASVGWRSAG